jgi:hypothetical protein
MSVPPYCDHMPLARLRTAELLLVTTVRLFAHSARYGLSQHWWKDLFGIIALSPRRKLAVAGMSYRLLCPDEGRFLQLVALLQRKDTGGAEDVLLNWVLPMAVRLSISHAQMLADGLADQGLLLPRRCETDAMFAEHAHRPVSAYLH